MKAVKFLGSLRWRFGKWLGLGWILMGGLFLIASFGPLPPKNLWGAVIMRGWNILLIILGLWIVSRPICPVCGTLRPVTLVGSTELFCEHRLGARIDFSVRVCNCCGRLVWWP